MADLVLFNPSRAVGQYEVGVAGALARFYNASTDTPREVFSDTQLTVPYIQPVVADENGVFPPVYVAGGGGLKVDVRNPITDVSLPGFPLDPAPVVFSGGGAASAVSFNPTAEVPVSTVQAAIERVQENIVAPLVEFGIGVTGNAPLIGNLDATDRGSGAARYDNTTIGTFPPTVTAGPGGIVTLWRRTANDAVMELYPAGRDGVFRRNLVGGVWGAWTGGTVVEEGGGTTDINGVLTITFARPWLDTNYRITAIHSGGGDARVIERTAFPRTQAQVQLQLFNNSGPVPSAAIQWQASGYR